MAKVQNRSTKDDKIISELPKACSDETAAVLFMEKQRWGETPCCPRCGSLDVYQMTDSRTGERQANFRWACRDCKRVKEKFQYTVRTGTVFEESRIELRHWCFGFWRASTSKKGVSALEIHRQTGISYKSCLFMLNRIRFAMSDSAEGPLSGDVEVDETYVGGKPRYRSSKNPRGTANKQAVMAMVERGGRVKTKPVAGKRLATGQPSTSTLLVSTNSEASYANGSVRLGSICTNQKPKLKNSRKSRQPKSSFLQLVLRRIRGNKMSKNLDKSPSIFQKDRLKLARQAKGMTLAALAGALGVSRQYVHKIENGDTAPNEENINALAALLDVKPWFFLRRVEHIVTNEDVNFRKQKTTKKHFENQVIAMSSFIREIAGLIADTVTIPKVSIPTCEFTDEASIELAAQKVRSELSLGNNAPIDSVTRVLEVMGVLCVDISGVQEKISALSVDLDMPLVIHNSKIEQVTRIRFDMAHEMGHLVGHRGMQTGDDLTERQADKFAASFLVPSAAFRANCPLRGRGRINWSAMREFKQEWKISYRAIIRRAYDMGLIDAAVYKSANIHLSSAGYSKQEPHEPEGAETPALISTAITVLRNDLEPYLREMLNTVGMTESLAGSLLGVEIPQLPDLKNVVMLSRYKSEKKLAN